MTLPLIASLVLNAVGLAVVLVLAVAMMGHARHGREMERQRNDALELVTVVAKQRDDAMALARRAMDGLHSVGDAQRATLETIERMNGEVEAALTATIGGRTVTEGAETRKRRLGIVP